MIFGCRMFLMMLSFLPAALTPPPEEDFWQEDFESFTLPKESTGLVLSRADNPYLKEGNRWQLSFQKPQTLGLTLPKTPALDGDFTFQCFLRQTHRDGYAAIAADWNEDDNQRTWALMITPRGGLRFDISPDGHFYSQNKLETAGRLLQLGTWYHVAATSHGSVSRIYLNGHLVAETTRQVPGIRGGQHHQIRLGSAHSYSGNHTRPLSGDIDQVALSIGMAAEDQWKTHLPSMPPVTGPVPVQYQLPFQATTAPEAFAWQKEAHKRLEALVQQQEPLHTLQQVPLDFRIDSSETFENYVRHSASFQANNGKDRFPCYLTIPKGKGPFPAIVALHGHGGSRDAVFDPETPYKAFAQQLASQGYVVIAPSFPHRQHCGTLLWDLKRLVDILETRDEVDTKRIGAAGLSMGGEWTMWLSACDQRIQCAVVSGWMCTTEGVFSVPNCECWELPGLVPLMDICEVHLLMAPRPLLLESAEYDNCFPIRSTKEGFRRLQQGYKVFSAEQNVQQDVWPAGHQWHGEKAMPFLKAHLGNDSN